MSFDICKCKTQLGGERGALLRGMHPWGSSHASPPALAWDIGRAWNGWTCSDSSREFKVSLETVSGLSLLSAAAAALIWDSCSSPSSQCQPHHHLLTIPHSVNCPQEPRALADHTIHTKNHTEEFLLKTIIQLKEGCFLRKVLTEIFTFFWSSMS